MNGSVLIISMSSTWVAFLGTSKLHKKRFCSSMLINLSCLPDGHQRTLYNICIYVCHGWATNDMSGWFMEGHLHTQFGNSKDHVQEKEQDLQTHHLILPTWASREVIFSNWGEFNSPYNSGICHIAAPYDSPSRIFNFIRSLATLEPLIAAKWKQKQCNEITKKKKKLNYANHP